MKISDTDKESIRRTVTSVGEMWDSHRFAEAKEFFTSIVEIDYTSLGAPAVTQDPIDQLESNWKAVLPMFDKTAHHIDTFTFTSLDSNTVRVNSKVLAYHFLSNSTTGDDSWVLRGRYTHELLKNDNWKISKMKLTVEEQSGNLALIIEATQRKTKNK